MTNFQFPIKLAKFLIGLFVFIGIYWIIGNSSVSAQDSNAAAKKHGVTFPIAALGNCKDYADCRTFCSDPVNKDACIAFAKSKGFYKEDTKDSNAILQKAKQVLGCDAIASCKSFCENSQNFDKCHQFAQNAGLNGGYKEDPRKLEVLGKAEKVFGCTSYDTCKSFCENPVNRDKCAQFAQTAGLNGGYEYKGPGGCTSEETCRTFCSNPGNSDTCRNYSQSQGATRVNFDPQAECRKYPGCSWAGNYCQCNQNDQGNLERQKSQCSSYPGCSWTGSTCQCSGTGVYGNSRESQETACKAGGGTCNWSGDSCNCQGYDSSKDTRPETQCARSGAGCYWTGTSCKCNTSGGSPVPWTSGAPSYGDASKGDYSCGQAALAVGCYTQNKTCVCPGGSGGSSGGSYATPYSGGGTYDPATECAKHAGCSWTGSWCNCSGGGSTATSQPSTQTQPPSQTQAPSQTSAPSQSSTQAPSQTSAPSSTMPPVQGAETIVSWLQELLYRLESLFAK